MILRFTKDLAIGFTSNQAERDVWPVKVQMRTPGGCGRTLDARSPISRSCSPAWLPPPRQVGNRPARGP